jgi:hypothetical protein
MDQPTEYCVFCGKPIPVPDLPNALPFVRHLYCSTSCAARQQQAIRRLRRSTPEPTPEQEWSDPSTLLRPAGV